MNGNKLSQNENPPQDPKETKNPVENYSLVSLKNTKVKKEILIVLGASLVVGAVALILNTAPQKAPSPSSKDNPKTSREETTVVQGQKLFELGPESSRYTTATATLKNLLPENDYKLGSALFLSTEETLPEGGYFSNLPGVPLPRYVNFTHKTKLYQYDTIKKYNKPLPLSPGLETTIFSYSNTTYLNENHGILMLVPQGSRPTKEYFLTSTTEEYMKIESLNEASNIQAKANAGYFHNISQLGEDSFLLHRGHGDSCATGGVYYIFNTTNLETEVLLHHGEGCDDSRAASFGYVRNKIIISDHTWNFTGEGYILQSINEAPFDNNFYTNLKTIDPITRNTETLLTEEEMPEQIWDIIVDENDLIHLVSDVTNKQGYIFNLATNQLSDLTEVKTFYDYIPSRTKHNKPFIQISESEDKLTLGNTLPLQELHVYPYDKYLVVQTDAGKQVVYLSAERFQELYLRQAGLSACSDHIDYVFSDRTITDDGVINLLVKQVIKDSTFEIETPSSCATLIEQVIPIALDTATGTAYDVSVQ